MCWGRRCSRGRVGEPTWRPAAARARHLAAGGKVGAQGGFSTWQQGVSCLCGQGHLTWGQEGIVRGLLMSTITAVLLCNPPPPPARPGQAPLVWPLRHDHAASCGCLFLPSVGGDWGVCGCVLVGRRPGGPICCSVSCSPCCVPATPCGVHRTCTPACGEQHGVANAICHRSR
jgi:hypothetical protein